VLRVRKIAGSNPGRVKSETEQITPISSLISVYHLRSRAGLVDPMSD